MLELVAIKMYLKYAVIAGLVGLVITSYTYTYYHGKTNGQKEVQVLFDSYKENIDAQVRVAKARAETEKAEQDKLVAEAKSHYTLTSIKLDNALARLRNLQAMSGNGSLPVAESGVSSVSTKDGDSTRTDQRSIVVSGACQGSEFYSAALKDTLQCQQLIELIKKKL